MTRDSGSLSIDFLIGFTIFLIAFIWVVSMIPGLLIGLQSYTIDYDAVAYRTGVILVEDPGEPALPSFPWETLTKQDVVRFGLAMSKDTPNILSQNKVDSFFCSTVFSYPVDYQQRAIFGDYPYQFNISLTEFARNKSWFIGDIMSGNYGSIRRLVKIKEPSYATINYTYMTAHQYYYTGSPANGGNETEHEFSILINNTELLNGKVRDPIYQINPAREKITINITDLNSTLWPDRQNCFNVNLTRIYALDPAFVRIQLFTDPVIDGVPYHGINTEAMYTTLPYVTNNISLPLDPSFLPWSNYPREVYLNLTFDLTPAPTNTGCNAAIFSGTDPVRGSRFLNNSLISAFDYNYNPDSVTQPGLIDGMLEVDAASGYRTISQTLIVPLAAAFKYTIQTGAPTFTVKFTDQSTGSPVEWAWDFTNNGTVDSTLNNPSYDYRLAGGAGIYTVKLTVKDASGNSASIIKNVDLSKPIAGLSGTPLSGNSPLNVQFTDTSTGGAPSNWFMDFGDLSNSSSPGPWSHTYTAGGTYTANLTVSNIFGSSSATNQVTVIPPTVTGISPTAGLLAGGTSVTITGTGFTGATAVKFGVTSATSFTVNSDTSITATSPAGSGTVHVTVTTPGGTSATSAADQFTYTAAPTVTSISPTSGPAAGGTSVIITGTGFTGATAVTFGATAATSFTVNSATKITATSPAGAGRVDVTVTTPGGTSATSAADRFSYVPSVTSISPAAGPLAGGTSVVITGTGFTGATAVTFGATAATSFTVNSATQITATSPAGAGTVHITVTTPGGTSTTSAADQFTYSAAPTVTGISPTSGPAAGGTSVTITGTGFTGATAVTFGATAATSFTVNSATQITAISPAKAAGGTVDVTVTTVGGTSATSANDRFTYTGMTPTVTSISPSSGSRNGGTSVTITGTGFTSAATVKFGVTAGTGVTFVSDTQITVTSPAKAAGGTIDVTVTTVGGTSATSANDRFTYTGVAPTVTSISPSSGPAAGGTSVTITGTGFTSAATVSFGVTAGTSVTFVSDTQITVNSPAGSGRVHVTVTTVGGTSTTSNADRFSYIPSVTGISPISGTHNGGTSVIITGTGFTGATAVTFGATAATSFTVNSATQITATAPAHLAGTIDVTVTTIGGTSATSSADQFKYT